MIEKIEDWLFDGVGQTVLFTFLFGLLALVVIGLLVTLVGGAIAVIRCVQDPICEVFSVWEHNRVVIHDAPTG